MGCPGAGARDQARRNGSAYPQQTLAPQAPARAAGLHRSPGIAPSPAGRERVGVRVGAARATLIPRLLPLAGEGANNRSPEVAMRVSLLAVAMLACGLAQAASPLPALNVDKTKISVS